MGRKYTTGIGLFLLGAASGVGAMWLARPATGPAEVRIAQVLPTGPADDADRLTIIFDRPIVEPRDVDQPLAKAPFELVPPRRGSWSWAAVDKLEYQLTERLAPGRIYRLTPQADAGAAFGVRIVGEDRYEIRTRALAVESTDIQSTDRTHINVRVRFNQSVFPHQLAEHIRIEDSHDNSPLAAQCLTRDASSEQMIRFARPESNHARLVVKGDLVGADGELGLGTAFSRVFELDAPFSVNRAISWPGAFEEKLEVGVELSRWLKYDQATPVVHVTPPVGDVKVRISGDEVRVKGKFECGKRYAIRVEPGLVANDGTIMSEAASATIRIPDRRAAIRMPKSRGILSPGGNMELEVRTVNCPELECTATRVYPNNLVAHLHGNDESETGKDVGHKTLKVEATHNQPTTALLELNEILPPTAGMYYVRVHSTENRWESDQAVIAVTDLGITCERAADGIVAWITSIETAAPIAGVTVEARSYTNQVLASGTTDADGLARLNVVENHTDGTPWVLIATSSHDTSFLRLDRNVWSPDGVALDGRDYPRNYDVCLFAERGAYRPGDTIHLSGIIRTADGETPPAFPIVIHASRPDGRNIFTKTIQPEADKQGTFHVDIETRENSQLGRYSFAAKIPGSSRSLGETTALVEAFLPVRLDVVAEATSNLFTGKATPEVNVQAKYLFGKPAADLPVTISGKYRQIGFDTDVAQGYRFGPLDLNAESVIEARELALGNDGTLEAAVPNAPTTPGRWRADVIATVSEPGSRSVSARTQFVCDPVGRHVGIQLPMGESCSIPADVEFKWRQVDGDGAEAKPGAIELVVERIEYDWTIREVDERRVWQSVERRIPCKKRTINKNDGAANGQSSFAVKTPGLYRVRLTDVNSGAVAEQEFHAFEGGSYDESFATQLPEQLDLRLEKPKYAPGETATLTVRGALTGSLLVTVETDHVVATHVLAMTAKSQTIEIPVPEGLRTDAFVSAVVVRPLEKSAEKWRPMRGRGITRLPIDTSGRLLPLTIAGVEEGRPGQQVAIHVHAGAEDSEAALTTPAVVQLWAVDEGILATTAFRTPNPYDYFFAPRRRSIESTDLFAELLPDFARPESMLRVGADGDGEKEPAGADGDSLQRSPVSMKRKGGDVIWLAAKTTDESGDIDFDITLPETQGRIRLMATAVSGDHYGASERPIRIVAPLMIETQFARFLAPEDTYHIPARVFNNNETPIEVDMTATIDGPATIEFAEGKSHVTIPAGGSETIWLTSRAVEMGDVSIELSATAELPGGEVLQAHTRGSLPIRPVTAIRTISTTHQYDAGESLTLDPPDGLLLDTLRTRLRISPDPTAGLEPAYDSLIDYPYGCVEQTSSRMRALFCAKSMSSELESDGAAIDNMIEAGIARLWSMQTPSGGIAYWPGQSEPDLWGSAYAATVLCDIANVGYKIDAGFLDDLLDYLERSLKDNNDDDRNIMPMIAYALARFERPQVGWMAGMTERPASLDAEARAYLARAWVAAGRKDRADALLTPEVLSLVTVSATRSGRITSPVSQNAALLDAVMDFNPDSDWVPQLVDRLTQRQKDGTWMTTRDNAAALAALIRCVDEDRTPPDYAGSMAIGDDAPVAFDSTNSITRTLTSAKPIHIETSGEGRLYVACTHEGLSTETKDDNQYDRGLKVRRRWLASDDTPVDPSKVKVGDLIRVLVTVSAPGLSDGDEVPNVAIIDALPGCMEAENPGLATSAVSETDQHGLRPDLIQYLDDRVLIFASASKAEQTIEYHVRVVALGDFAAPPIEAACMYDPMLASRNGGGRIIVMQ
ncbi:MAG: hypothetical protein H6818_08990 [Phycisphaerales bacterium]|nr:hypothetical protein [Phycisphaerales bacterium]MCB9862705.1 hypothetical protein [Phycisphaerales bacterium]